MHLIRFGRQRPQTRVEPLSDGALLHTSRRGRVTETLRLGPNAVHAFITHDDGTVDDLGISHNLLTNAGRDLAAAALGHPAAKYGALTASGATTATPSGGGLSVDAYKGYRVFCPLSAITTAPIYGNIGSNSTTVLTVDQWWDGADAAASTPASTNGYYIQAIFEPRFMGITADSGAANAASTTLTSEQTANGLARAICTYAHTGGTATLTMVKAWSPSGTVTGLHRIGLFTAKDTTAAGVICFEAVLSADASVVNGDTLTVTDTITLS